MNKQFVINFKNFFFKNILFIIEENSKKDKTKISKSDIIKK